MKNTDFAFGMNGQNYPILIKEKAADIMKNIINDDDFITILEGKHGTHSINKYGDNDIQKVQTLTI